MEAESPRYDPSAALMVVAAAYRKDPVRYRAYANEWYRRNRELVGAQRRARRPLTRTANIAHVKNARELRSAFVDAARAGGCVDCGNKNLSVLHSDHRPGMKAGRKSGISQMVVSCVPLKRLFDELDKCETRCANCHMLVTAERRGRVA